jgi:hypothetical protein
MMLDLQNAQMLLNTIQETGRAAEVDWVNQTIRVLSEVKTHPTKVLSSGPMTYQDILLEISERGITRTGIKPKVTNHKIECGLCNTTITSVEAAIDAGWLPSYYDGDDEVLGPVCPECTKSKLEIDPETEEYFLR